MEVLQILTLLHEGDANVLDWWIQLQQELCILNLGKENAAQICQENFTYINYGIKP